MLYSSFKFKERISCVFSVTYVCIIFQILRFHLEFVGQNPVGVLAPVSTGSSLKKTINVNKLKISYPPCFQVPKLPRAPFCSLEALGQWEPVIVKKTKQTKNSWIATADWDRQILPVWNTLWIGTLILSLYYVDFTSQNSSCLAMAGVVSGRWSSKHLETQQLRTTGLAPCF